MTVSDITGLAGIALAIATLTLRLPFLARLQSKQKIGLAVALSVVLAVPFGDLSVLELLRGILGDLSVTTLLLLGYAGSRLCTPTHEPPLWEADLPRRGSCALWVSGESWNNHRPIPKGREFHVRPLLLLIAIAALALYPFALGIGTFDPYRLGYANLWFLAGLLCLALAAYLRQYPLIVLSITLAVLAWSVDWYESDNLWNYLLDPWVSVYAITTLCKRTLKNIIVDYFCN